MSPRGGSQGGGVRQRVERPFKLDGSVTVRWIVILRVELKNERDIVVSHPELGFSVTYRKDEDAPMLVAIDGIDQSDDPLKVKFWAQAWKAAYQKARTVGWLSA
jgi:hypothetical protein